MSLETEGKVVLKIYNEKGQLLIARPCPNESFAETWYKDYTDRQEARKLTYSITPMIPRI